MTQDVTGDPYTAELLKHLQATRQAERDVFSRLEPAVRDRPMRDDDWSPKDHQAHLTMWKARQARYEALREGREPLSDAREDDEINAELHATRADWDWDAIEREADEVSARLESEVRARGSGGVPGQRTPGRKHLRQRPVPRPDPFRLADRGERRD